MGDVGGGTPGGNTMDPATGGVRKRAPIGFGEGFQPAGGYDQPPVQAAPRRPTDISLPSAGPKDNQPGGDVWRAPTQAPQQNGPRRAMPGMPMKPAVGAPQGGGFQRPSWGNSGSGSSGIGNIATPVGGPRQTPSFSGGVPDAVLQRIKQMQMRRGPSGGAPINPNDPNRGAGPVRDNGLNEGGRRPQPGAADPFAGAGEFHNLPSRQDEYKPTPTQWGGNNPGGGTSV